jgi:hypothetical protein
MRRQSPRQVPGLFITRKEDCVEEIDLEYVLLGWQQRLNGEALRERYGDRVGFHYSEAEDEGIFWSNAREDGHIRPRPSFGLPRCASSRPHHASALQKGRKNENISGVIWGIPVHARS